ncbi:hypothetical protein ACA910_009619 [Epithemia clementina (nom. ined.)]
MPPDDALDDGNDGELEPDPEEPEDKDAILEVSLNDAEEESSFDDDTQDDDQYKTGNSGEGHYEAGDPDTSMDEEQEELTDHAAAIGQIFRAPDANDNNEGDEEVIFVENEEEPTSDEPHEKPPASRYTMGPKL